MPPRKQPNPPYSKSKDTSSSARNRAPPRRTHDAQPSSPTDQFIPQIQRTTTDHQASSSSHAVPSEQWTPTDAQERQSSAPVPQGTYSSQRAPVESQAYSQSQASSSARNIQDYQGARAETRGRGSSSDHTVPQEPRQSSPRRGDPGFVHIQYAQFPRTPPRVIRNPDPNLPRESDFTGYPDSFIDPAIRNLGFPDVSVRERPGAHRPDGQIYPGASNLRWPLPPGNAQGVPESQGGRQDAGGSGSAQTPGRGAAVRGGHGGLPDRTVRATAAPDHQIMGSGPMLHSAAPGQQSRGQQEPPSQHTSAGRHAREQRIHPQQIMPIQQGDVYEGHGQPAPPSEQRAPGQQGHPQAGPSSHHDRGQQGRDPRSASPHSPSDQQGSSGRHRSPLQQRSPRQQRSPKSSKKDFWSSVLPKKG